MDVVLLTEFEGKTLTSVAKGDLVSMQALEDEAEKKPTKRKPSSKNSSKDENVRV